MIISLCAVVATVYLSVIAFNNRSSIEFLKKMFTHDQQQMLDQSERMRSLEGMISKIVADQNKDVYAMHSAAQIAVALGLSKTQVLWLAEHDYICIDKVNRELKMTEAQIADAKEILKDKQEAIKACRSIDDFAKIFSE